jgi:hypothetical protein
MAPLSVETLGRSTRRLPEVGATKIPFVALAALMPPAPGAKQRSLIARQRTLGNGPLTVKHLRFEWDWQGTGPVSFEVYHAATLAGFSWQGGTNIPKPFTFWTNVLASPVPIEADQAAEFFIVRAANSAGVSDWPTPP